MKNVFFALVAFTLSMPAFAGEQYYCKGNFGTSEETTLFVKALSHDSAIEGEKMEYLIVPYKGSAPAYQDLIGGSVDAFIDPILGSASFAKAGQLKVLAVTSKNRVPSQPDLPTVGETVPGYEFYSWYGLWGPASLPKEIAVRLNAEVNKALATDMREQLTPQGLLLTPGSIDDFVRFQKDDMALSQRIVTEGKIRAE
jgi:tripartite-type tricarboxylate transporter receptor subunit TctC